VIAVALLLFAVSAGLFAVGVHRIIEQIHERG
jgi:hypothetical protein